MSISQWPEVRKLLEKSRAIIELSSRGYDLTEIDINNAKSILEELCIMIISIRIGIDAGVTPSLQEFTILSEYDKLAKLVPEYVKKIESKTKTKFEKEFQFEKDFTEEAVKIIEERAAAKRVKEAARVKAEAQKAAFDGSKSSAVATNTKSGFLRSIGRRLGLGGGQPPKPSTYHRTATHHKHAGHNYVVYTGPRGGRYIKRGGAYISIARL